MYCFPKVRFGSGGACFLFPLVSDKGPHVILGRNHVVRSCHQAYSKAAADAATRGNSCGL